MKTTSSRARSALAAVAVAVAAAVALTPGTAVAQPSAADLESARELYKEAKALRDKGDLRGALDKFKAAHGYGQTPVTGLELGKTYAALGQLVEAREVLLSVGRRKVEPDETDKSAAARTEADRLAEQIRSKIPTLNVKVTGVPADAPLAMTVDGANVPVVGLAATRKTNPGTHALVVRLGAREQRRAVELKEGETKEEAVAFDAAAAKGEPDKPIEPEGGSISPITWIGASVALVGVGAIFGLAALGKASAVRAQCEDVKCPPSARADVDSGRSAAIVSTIGFSVGAAGLVTAFVGYFILSRPKSAGANARIVASPSWIGLDGAF